MKALINCFIPYANDVQAEQTIQGLKDTGLIDTIYLLSTQAIESIPEGCKELRITYLNASQTIWSISENATTPYTLIYTKYSTLKLGMFALDRMVQIADDTLAGMVYADHYKVIDGTQKQSPVIDYQSGSLRDDFNFGSVLLFNSSFMKTSASRMVHPYESAGFYDLRLKLSQVYELVHINEYLYSEIGRASCRERVLRLV